MKIAHHAGELRDVEADLAIVGAFADEPLPTVAAGLLEVEDFDGRFKKTLLLYPRAAVQPPEASSRAGTAASSAPLAAKRLMLIGLGRRSEVTVERMRQAYAAAAIAARDFATSTLVVETPDVAGLEGEEVAGAIVEALLLALYRFDQFKGSASRKDQESRQHVERIVLTGGGERAQQCIETAELVFGGIKLARDLGNEPPLVCTPTRLARAAEEIASRGSMRLTVLDRPQMEELGMGALLGVARGSVEPPKFIVFEYGSKGQGKTIAIVGKGITFDSGGISIKPAEKMDQMKMDMMGAAAVLGTMSALADLRPQHVHVVGIVAAAENLPSGSAFKPGDILKAMNGVTIEILNTDAEGRLALADGLAYAQRFEPDVIIDLATLTGAAVVGLGHHVSGLITNNAELANRVKAAGEKTGELVWELPLLPEYREAVKSRVADIRNSTGRAAGTIKAGAFLEHFVDGRPWVHLDIAGTGTAPEAAEKPKPYAQEGATGYGVRLLIDLITSYAEASA